MFLPLFAKGTRMRSFFYVGILPVRAGANMVKSTNVKLILEDPA